MNLFLFFLALPGLNVFLKSRTLLSPQALDLRIIKYSLLILVIGSILIAFALTSFLLTLCRRTFFSRLAIR